MTSRAIPVLLYSLDLWIRCPNSNYLRHLIEFSQRLLGVDLTLAAGLGQSLFLSPVPPKLGVLRLNVRR